MKVRVSTRNFENTHGKAPRGSGLWMFAFGENPDDMSTWFSFQGTFAVARSKAVQQAKRDNVTVVHVCP